MQRRDFTDHTNRAAQLRFIGVLPALVFGFIQHFAHGHGRAAGVEHEDVRCAEFAIGFADEPVYVGGVAHVACPRQHAHAVLLGDFGRLGAQRIRRAREHHEVDTLGCKRARGVFTKATACGGDDGGFTGDAEIHKGVPRWCLTL